MGASLFKPFVLDRLAVGIPPEVIASEASAFLDQLVSKEDVTAVVSSEEITIRQTELMEEIKHSSPILAQETLSTLRKVKKFINIAEEKFNNEELSAKDFDNYRKAIELMFKGLDSFANQLKALQITNDEKPTININFSMSDLKRLEGSGAVKIIDAELAEDLVGHEEEA